MKSKDASLNPNIVPFAKLGSNIQDMWTKSLNNNVIDAASRIKFKKSNIIQNVNLSKDISVTVDPDTKITDATNQFLNAIIVLWNQTPGHDNSFIVNINLLDYMQLKGIEDTPNNRKNTARRMRKLTNDLFAIAVKAVLKDNKGRVFDYNARILQSNMLARDGNDYSLKLSDDFYNAMVTAAYVLPFPIELLRLDTSKSKYTWRIGYYLTRYQKMVIQHHRQQEEKLESVTDMNTLLNQIGILNQKGRNIYSHIIKRVIKALNQLSQELHLFDYYITDNKGNKTNYFRQLPLTEFKKYKLHVKWKNYPKEWVPLNGKHRK